MGNFIESSYPSIEECVNRWDSYGLLDSIESDGAKKLVAMALDATAICITKLNYRKFKDDTKTTLLPVIVRVFRKTEDSFDFETLLKWVEIIINDFTEKYEKEIFNKIETEAEFVYQYCNNFQFN